MHGPGQHRIGHRRGWKAAAGLPLLRVLLLVLDLEAGVVPSLAADAFPQCASAASTTSGFLLLGSEPCSAVACLC